ncbi:signal recognition particle 54 kDa protein 2 [Prunus yedoensis var. nudiflora]|uniref:Signal recognition particle 54 kDa protein 2 n=1 Tax=Prunus yedoensis var. nudiflora TaxID=2094558 RepID=A0A314XZ78_PRUYE|nr:signal recognition particle 54 kDa protein 2 [Prunus yedoensis var. nudiflora]
MVLAQFGGSIARALQQMSNATVIDERVLNECLNEITRALLQSDAQSKLVRDMQTNIKKIVNLDDLAAGHNRGKIIQQLHPTMCASRLCLTNFEKCWIQGNHNSLPRKGNQVLSCFLVYKGLEKPQCVQNMHIIIRKNAWKPALVCAIEGVETFSKENYDLIIVDTSGRHNKKLLFMKKCVKFLKQREGTCNLGIGDLKSLKGNQPT